MTAIKDIQSMKCVKSPTAWYCHKRRHKLMPLQPGPGYQLPTNPQRILEIANWASRPCGWGPNVPAWSGSDKTAMISDCSLQKLQSFPRKFTEILCIWESAMWIARIARQAMWQMILSRSFRLVRFVRAPSGKPICARSCRGWGTPKNPHDILHVGTMDPCDQNSGMDHQCDPGIYHGESETLLVYSPKVLPNQCNKMWFQLVMQR
jgi:hypothetical protein